MTLHVKAIELEANSALDDPEINLALKDSVVKRLEYTSQASWQALRLLLLHIDSIDVSSPKKTITNAFDQSYIIELSLWQQSLDLRNETNHAYGASYGNKAYHFAEEHRHIFADAIKVIESKI